MLGGVSLKKTSSQGTRMLRTTLQAPTLSLCYTLAHVAPTADHANTRFCGDCKHNVVTAFDILTCKCDLADIDNEDEFLPDLFWPFAGRIGPMPGDLTGQKALLSCPLEVGVGARVSGIHGPPIAGCSWSGCCLLVA